MFESLTERFEGIVGRLRGRGRLTESDVDEVLAEIRTALLEADVEFGVVRGFTQRVRDRCVGLELSSALSPGQQVIKIVNEELTGILGGETLKLTYAGRPPTVVLLAGLQGSGKTTAAAKLAKWFRQQGRNPLLVGADLQRPAAVEQLRVLGGQVGVNVFSEPTDPVAVATAGLAEASRLGRDVLIVDTAGRLSVDEALMQEIRDIAGATDPHYTFLVIDAMTGQDAVTTAFAFHEALTLDGVILTKLDGDARGGAALSVKEVVGRPIAFGRQGRSSTTSTCSTRIAWPTGFSAWATSSASSSKPNARSTRTCPPRGRPPFSRGVSRSRTSSSSCNRSRSWARSPASSPTSPGCRRT